MSDILYSYPSLPSNFRNLIVITDVGFISTPENPYNYEKGSKYIRQSHLRYDLTKPFIMGKRRCDKEKDVINDSGYPSVMIPPVFSIPTEMIFSRNSHRITQLDTNRCEDIYKKYEKFVNTNRDRLVATVAHSVVTHIFYFSRRMSRFRPRTKLIVKDKELHSFSSIYKKGFSKTMPLLTNETKTEVETSKENFEINFNFPLCNIFWRDDYYLKIYSSGLLEFIPVKYNFTLFIKGEYSVLKEQKFDDDILVSPT